MLCKFDAQEYIYPKTKILILVNVINKHYNWFILNVVRLFCKTIINCYKDEISMNVCLMNIFNQ